MARATTKKSNTRRSRAATKPAKVAVAVTKQSVSEEPTVATTRATKFPSSWQLLVKVLRLWRQHTRVLAIYILVLVGLNLVLVHNFGVDAEALKSQVTQVLGGSTPVSNAATYALFVGGSGGNAQGAAAVYQYLLVVLVSLSTIWLLRQLLSDNTPTKLRVRDSFYQGMYPLVPFVLVLLVLSLELIPLVLGTLLYVTVVQNGIAIGMAQDIIWLLVMLLGATITLWLLARSVFGLYIATLPNMTPVLALRNARQLARGQKANIIRKALFLALFFLVISAAVLIPIIAVVPVLAGVSLFVLSVLALPAAHSYFYMMYRELLDD